MVQKEELIIEALLFASSADINVPGFNSNNDLKLIELAEQIKKDSKIKLNKDRINIDKDMIADNPDRIRRLLTTFPELASSDDNELNTTTLYQSINTLLHNHIKSDFVKDALIKKIIVLCAIT